VADGGVEIVIVAVPVCVFVHPFAPEIPSSLYSNVPRVAVETLKVTVFPDVVEIV